MNEKITYLEKVKAQVRDCDSEVERLAARVERSSGETRVVYEEQVEDLRGQCDALTHRLEDAQWSEEAWDDVKQGVQSALNGLKSSIEKARSRLK